MYRLVETICIIDGQPQFLDYHQHRVTESCKALFPACRIPQLTDYVSPPPESESGSVKCRVIYGPDIVSITYTPYEIRSISAITLVHVADLTYDYKFEQRPSLDALFARKGKSDEIFIIRNNLLTDAYYYNIGALRNGKWVTPRFPLLRGTCRQRLLTEGFLTEADISVADIPSITMWQLFNAMTPPGTIVLTPDQILPEELLKKTM